MKEAILVIAIVMAAVFGHGLVSVESEIKSGVVKMNGKIYACSEWNYYPTKGNKK